jgi:peptide chain release factor 2
VWSSPQLTRDLLKRKSKLEDIILNFESLSEKLAYLEESIGILEEESGDLFLNDLRKEIRDLKEELELLEIRNLLSGEMDKNNAILAIHPGAGGTRKTGPKC